MAPGETKSDFWPEGLNWHLFLAETDLFNFSV